MAGEGGEGEKTAREEGVGALNFCPIVRGRGEKKEGGGNVLCPEGRLRELD